MTNLSLLKPNEKPQERIGIKSEFGFDIRATEGCSVAKRMSEPFKPLFSPEETQGIFIGQLQ